MIEYSQYKMTKSELLKTLAVGLLLIWGITYLFYKNLVIMLLFSPCCIFLVKMQKNRLRDKRLFELDMQFKEGMINISTALNAGYSIENSIYEATKDLLLLYDEDAYIIQEFKYMLYELQINKTIEEVFMEFANRAHLEDITNLVDVFITAKRTGGDIVKIIAATSKNINDKIDVRREIQTLITAKKFESNIMCVIPLGIIVYMWLTSSGYLDILYNNLFGIMVMTVLLAVYIIAYALCIHLTKIQV